MPTTYAKQNKILKKHFGVTVAHPDKDGMYLVPSWNRIADTYPKALQLVLDDLKKDRPFYNYRKGQIDDKHIRRSTNVPEAFTAQMGEKYKGVSVQIVRSMFDKDSEFLLGAYEVAVILLTHPDILKSYDDLWIDCAGDEFSPGAGGDFSHAPCFGFNGGEVRFAAKHVGYASDHYGSASGFSPQPLETGTLDAHESSTLGSSNSLPEVLFINGKKYVMQK